jgi:hypothetical protein
MYQSAIYLVEPSSVIHINVLINIIPVIII